MHASVRILWVAASGVALALMLVAATPAALAYDDTPISPHLRNAVHPLVNFSSGHASYEDGPVELPHPIDPVPGTFSAPASMTPTAPTSGKLESAALTGAMPGARGAGPIVDSATRAERSIRQVIRKLG
ncbi:MAG TPA: hypothetical protein VFV75_08280 [Candidatus Polarisedimenticolaceae bacterium]|nr:hypothetical protein [Candidatus Polarisedimenticolaceae bacterium]